MRGIRRTENRASTVVVVSVTEVPEVFDSKDHNVAEVFGKVLELGPSEVTRRDVTGGIRLGMRR